ncbi:hypothetical protein VTJ83DRAFT_3976 [Remersonia thermophila]|uniref:Mediator of RNA polymerase II transcription subunit 1 n=1 Tax=Remersonia thermophila TaxID=72144 RepID=A0ABR4DG45_9PEZI
MSTPRGLPLSQQGRTPSQTHHGAAATPAASTPFSITQAAFSPHGPRSSPQQVKKSPATMATLGRGSIGPVNFDSPSVSAALDALGINPAADSVLDGFPDLSLSSEEDKAMRLDWVISTLSRSKGLVSEAGLERLAKKLELEFMWEKGIGSDDKKTLIIAGSALELLIEFSNNVVQLVTLSFPDSTEIVNKHAGAASEILSKGLQLVEGQSPLTKSLDRFAANFERLAMLDKLSINPGLNMFEAVAGIYESLCRLHAWELQRARSEHPAVAEKGDKHLTNLVMCTKSGKPAMNERGRVGMAIDYWKEERFLVLDGALATRAADKDRIWTILIGCARLGGLDVSPVRISESWIGPDVVKVPLEGELETEGPIIDWMEPEATFVPASEQAKADPMQDSPLLGHRLPDAAFQAIFDPPVPMPSDLWFGIRRLGCVLTPDLPKENATFDSLVLAGRNLPPLQESKTISHKKMTSYVAAGETKISLASHAYTLHVDDAVFGRTVSEILFSHPQQLITILPYLRQYIFLATLLKRSFQETSDPSDLLGPAEKQSSASPGTPQPTTTTKTVTTNASDYESLMSDDPATPTFNAADGANSEGSALPIDVDLSITPDGPSLRVVFPFRDSQTAHVTLEIEQNGHVRVAAQDVLDERNATAPGGRQRTPEDLGALLERLEDLGKWVEFVRTRWA